MPIRVGDKASRAFVVDREAMRWFQQISEDTSLIHTDPDYARSRGFDDVIAYGGIMLAHLSHVLGMMIPGARGASTRWTIDYRRPLYVDEAARIDFEVVNTSPGTGIVEGRFKIRAGDRVIASGTTQSIVPPEDVADEADAAG